ncbi:hypothetical protein QZH41_007652 [Actinostola sp. cb2023]|nr:hypothetical protein QZH41_007652 [Actinostola sp. cb2023]
MIDPYKCHSSGAKQTSAKQCSSKWENGDRYGSQGCTTGEEHLEVGHVTIRSIRSFTNPFSELRCYIFTFDRRTRAFLSLPIRTGIMTSLKLFPLEEVFYKHGGWTIVKRTILQSTSPPKHATTYSNYKVIAAALDTNKNTVPLGAAMLDILNKMGFHQIHFYCHKKSVGRVVSIMTKNNTAGQQVVRYFTDDAFAKTTFPDACGSFDRLPEDTSILAQNCDKWGKDSAGTVQVNKWGYYGKHGVGRVSYRPFAMHGATLHGFAGVASVAV